ncbi:hypothetical protein ABG79_00489 [Caloramator mitchellensis]|uniref:DUF1576 domain-containing protein n=1 Tax=Caloramator mitchellensis TaxID=908809 RepID=A0A0R3JVY0_CALMK|nr:DUF1576 domain-containing protein [Caloramator mitchellensis]KRQ87688.1 hypothetical protein ABG79_00489 [Caloramator mitchellensis]
MKRREYALLILVNLFFFVIAFSFDSLREVSKGILSIINQSDLLITDYIAVGGVGAAFFNAGLVGAGIIFLYFINKLEINGALIAAYFTTVGFSLFGKNIVNIWPTIIGVYIFSLFNKDKFKNYILIALFGTTLSPAVVELAFLNILGKVPGLMLGIGIAGFIGFILPPIAKYSLKLHQGYCLYNMGLAGGLIATMMMSKFRAFGIDFERRLILSTGNNQMFTFIFLSLFVLLVVFALIIDEEAIKQYTCILKTTGRLYMDYYTDFGVGATLFNMGTMGILFVVYVLGIKGELTGPVLGAILTIVGFGALGKHLINTIPVLIGTYISAYLNIWEINSQSIILASLFGTNLAPIAGEFGWFAGIIAGFFHVSVVMNMSYLHGGLNLYNNGFAGGIVAIVLVPILSAIMRKKVEYKY